MGLYVSLSFDLIRVWFTSQSGSSSSILELKIKGLYKCAIVLKQGKVDQY